MIDSFNSYLQVQKHLGRTTTNDFKSISSDRFERTEWKPPSIAIDPLQFQCIYSIYMYMYMYIYTYYMTAILQFLLCSNFQACFYIERTRWLHMGIVHMRFRSIYFTQPWKSLNPSVHKSQTHSTSTSFNDNDGLWRENNSPRECTYHRGDVYANYSPVNIDVGLLSI